MFKVQKFKDGVVFPVWVQAKSARDGVVRVKGTSLKIKIAPLQKRGKQIGSALII